ncbi:MAG TPA: biopolymer transporter ExbD [Limnobacter sp.]|uniref:ExbD/TolR family protein n=1 Tax=Limnobacter sp. TaxID=2003368 RepID=UPI002E33D93C|nr:biopolymer transporter ExbD [Limnobacter sp.]HEX5484808.1 biopolymer transporter ExbD [Limnobacter sp.]
MAMGTLSNNEDEFNPEINTTPLVDVMLVLLIIFIITIPAINQSVKVDLPRTTAQEDPLKPESINVLIDAQGQVFWNSEQVNSEEMALRIENAAKKTPQPELHLRADRTTQYEKVVQVMAAAQNAGLEKIGFITDPLTAKP